jgi:uncharacterized protein (DUF1697 family)
MAVVVFLRGVNVGGYRTFRPSVFARELSDHEVLSIGAAGTFIVWKPGQLTRFRAELRRRLPFDSEVVLCQARDLIRLTTDNPFGCEPPRADVVRFVSVLPRPARVPPPIPTEFPSHGEWLVRIIAARGRFILGEYRRHMKTIGYLGELDKLVGLKVTTRNWSTMTTIVRILETQRLPRIPS